MLVSPNEMIHWAEALGYVGLAVIIFVETGVFFGFVLPGDSLLFVAGLLAAKGYFDIYIIMAIVILMAIAGYAFGYWFGDKLGHWLVNKKESIFFRKKYLDVARVFYDKHGGKAITLARVVPIVRTFIPIISGMVEMNYRRFCIYNVLGAFLWAGSFGLSGYFLGSKYPFLIEWLIPAALIIIILSVIPGVVAFVRSRLRQGQGK